MIAMHMHPDTRRRAHNITSLALIIGGALLAVGCQTSPLDMKGERSQYDRHDSLRNQWSEAYYEDEFGRRVPNLRGRLLSKE